MIYNAGYHEFVPRDLEGNLAFRLLVWDECAKSQLTRELVMKACQDDILFWVNCFGWQTNPEKLDEEDGPFITFPFQEEAILGTIQKNVLERELVLWEKSRKQGGTFMALFIDIWLNLFHRRKRSLLISHKEEAVEKSGDEDTLFGKIDFILDHLPSWMRGGIKAVKKSGVYPFPKTKSQIAGVSTTIRSGVGGRATRVLLDEFSKYNNGEAILGQLRDTGPGHLVATHYGVGGTWYDLCKRPDVTKFVLHWSKNPMYNRGLYRSDPSLKPHERIVDPLNPPPEGYPFVTDGSPKGGPCPGLRSPYYDRVCSGRTVREVAIHWDIDPAGAATAFFDHNELRDYIFKYSRDPVWVGEIGVNPDGSINSLTKRENGPLKLWVMPDEKAQRTGQWIRPSLFKLGGDISAGTGATPTCFAGGDAMTGRKILEYQNAHLTPERMAPIGVALCGLLSSPSGDRAQMIWDATGPTGETFGRAVLELGFRNVWFYRDEFKLNQKTSNSPGWHASPAGKRSLLERYRDALRTGKLTNPSESALKECLAFEYSKTGGIEHGESLRTEDPSAGRVNHSDQAIADALMWKLMEEAGAKKSPEERMQAEGYPPLSLGWMMEQEARDERNTYGQLFRR